eukprot:3720982-Rhodomonas_salina.1
MPGIPLEARRCAAPTAATRRVPRLFALPHLLPHPSHPRHQARPLLPRPLAPRVPRHLGALHARAGAHMLSLSPSLPPFLPPTLCRRLSSRCLVLHVHVTSPLLLFRWTCRGSRSCRRASGPRSSWASSTPSSPPSSMPPSASATSGWSSS